MTPRFRRVWLQLTADKRRFGVLCAAITVGLLLWARFLFLMALVTLVALYVWAEIPNRD